MNKIYKRYAESRGNKNTSAFVRETLINSCISS